MFNWGIVEVLVLIAIISVLFFGGKKIEEFARGLGKFSGEFKKGKAEAEKELEGMKNDLKQNKPHS